MTANLNCTNKEQRVQYTTFIHIGIIKKDIDTELHIMACNIEILIWKDARKLIKLVNPELCAIIDEWNPDPSYTIFKASYRYGDVVLKDGIFHVPMSAGKSIPLSRAEIPTTIQKALNYKSIPLGIIIKGGNEVFLEHLKTIISMAFFQSGALIGLWEALEPPISYFPRKIWQTSAGARSVFMLPKISEAGKHQKLKKIYGVHSPAPKHMFEHAKVFSELANSSNVQHDWTNEILFFSKKWLTPQTKNAGWLQFHHHLLELGWNLSAYNRNKITVDRIWQLFVTALEHEGHKPEPYLIDTTKKLIEIGLGVVPGFKPVGLRTSSGPMHLIQKIYVNDYGLKNYMPTIMEPYHLQKTGYHRNVYYSLQMPTLLKSQPRPKTQTKFIEKLRTLKVLMQNFLNKALNGQLKVEDTDINWLLHHIDFEYFHSEHDVYEQIRLSTDMPKEDSTLSYQSGHFGKRRFAACAPFVRGCVRITRKKG